MDFDKENLLGFYKGIKDKRAELNKQLNKYVMQDDFIDKNTNEYIYASLAQPPIKILNKNGSNDEMDFTVECPNCHNAVRYGDSIYMLNGYIYCNTKGCREYLTAKLGIRYEK